MTEQNKPWERPDPTPRQPMTPANPYAPQGYVNNPGPTYPATPGLPPTSPAYGPTPQPYGGDPNNGNTADIPWRPKPGCSFGEAVSRFWRGYVQFDGRSSRSEYWFATLFCVLCSMGASLIPIVGPILWGLAILLPGIAVVVRRLHDLSLSGWWYALYYGLCAVTGIPMLVGLFAMIGYSSDHMPVPVWAVGMLAGGGVTSLALGVAWIVLMCQPSNPQGARFDR